MNRRLLLIDPAARRWRLETLPVERLDRVPREKYFVLSQVLLLSAVDNPKKSTILAPLLRHT